MYINGVSHILFTLFLYEAEKFLKKFILFHSIALSPLTFSYIPASFYTIPLLLKKGSKTSCVVIATDNSQLHDILNQYIISHSETIAMRMSIVTKSLCSCDIVSLHTCNSDETYYISFTVSLRTDNSEISGYYFNVYISPTILEFFSIHYRNNLTNHDPSLIELQLLNYFLNPYNLFPSLPILLEVLNERELQDILYLLLNENILTPYHILLLIYAFPQHSLKLKHALSRNIIHDIVYVKHSTTMLTVRDIQEGIYAFEEILFFHLRNKNISNYPRFINHISQIVQSLRQLLLFHKKSFLQWFDEMTQEGFLYTILSCLNDTTIASALSQFPSLFDNLPQYISLRRVNEIKKQLEKSFSFAQILQSQATFVQSYIRCKVKLYRQNHIPFRTLLQKYISPEQMYYVLFEVGWFTIATALKGIPLHIVKESIKKLPLGAQYCIIDVHKGLLNPNIIHDEMQIQKARNILFTTHITLLYTNSIIDSSDVIQAFYRGCTPQSLQ